MTKSVINDCKYSLQEAHQNISYVQYVPERVNDLDSAVDSEFVPTAVKDAYFIVVTRVGVMYLICINQEGT